MSEYDICTKSFKPRLFVLLTDNFVQLGLVVQLYDFRFDALLSV